MSASADVEHVAVVCDSRGPDAARVEAFLSGQAAPAARWYAPREIGDLDAAVRAGHTRRVIYVRLEDLLEAIWHHEIELDRWLAAGVELDCVESAGQPAPAYLETVARSWQRWRQRHRRRQVVGGLVLSAIALAAAFTLIWLAS